MTHMLVHVILFECFSYLSAQYAVSPCPQFFEYVNDGNSVSGLIHLWPDRNQVSSLILRVNFTIAAQLQSSYVGRLEPVGDDLLLIKYNSGQPISFRVHFPVSSPLPKLTSMISNDNFICGGPGDEPGPSSYVTTLSLQSHLYLKSNGISPAIYPNYSYKPDNKKVFTTFDKKPQTKPGTIDFLFYNIGDDSPSFSKGQPITFENTNFDSLFDTLQQNPNIQDNNYNRPLFPSTQPNRPNQKYPLQQSVPSKYYPFHQTYPNQQIPVQTYPSQQNPVQTNPTQQYPVQTYPPQQNPVQTYPTQENPVQTYPPQQNPVQTYPPKQNPVQTYPSQQNPVQTYPNQQYPVQKYPTQQNKPPVTTRPIQRPQTTTPEPTYAIDERFPGNTQSKNTQCGVTASGNEKIPLIYKGDSFSRGDWPWMVAIYRRKDGGLTFVCSGTLVSDRHILSAAHCMRTKNSLTNLKDFVVKVGVYNLEDWSDDDITVTRTLASAVIHESYNASTLANDIMIAMFDRRVQFNDNIRPVCLWSGSTDIQRIVGASGIVAGWGQSELLSAGQGQPRMVTMPIVSTATCRASRPDFHKLTSAYTLCAGDRNGAGPCLGDSGGGLYLMERGRWSIRGIVSLSLRSDSNSCNLNEYVVFTDAAQYLAWIQYVMNT